MSFEVSPVELETLRAMAEDGERRLWAVLDPAALDPGAVGDLAGSLEGAARGEALSLFSGYASKKYAAFAPWLVRADPARLGRILERGEGGWGLFLVSSVFPRRLYRHLRHLLRARLPRGGTSLFRFYDPAIFASLVEIEDEALTQSLFGDAIQQFIVGTGSRTEPLLSYRPRGARPC